MKKYNYSKFKKLVQHKKDGLTTILLVEPIATRIAYIIYKYNLPISPNFITYLRLLVIFPLTLGVLIYNIFIPSSSNFIIVAVLFYIGLISDVVDGEVARGKKIITKKGAILDSIADRYGMIIFFFFVLSFSFLVNDIYLRVLAYLLILLKMVNIISISMIWYHTKKVEVPREKKKEKQETQKISLLQKYINRWCGTVTMFDVYFSVIIIPSILIYLNFFLMVRLILYFMSLYLIVYYIRDTNTYLKEISE